MINKNNYFKIIIVSVMSLILCIFTGLIIYEKANASDEVIERIPAKSSIVEKVIPNDRKDFHIEKIENEILLVKNPEQNVTNPEVPAAPSEFIEVLSAHVTAYTHTGEPTATGTYPRSTRTIENPGTCAVVPETIPYGSLIYVTGYGYCIAEDTGAFRHNPDRWNQIDLFMNTEDECLLWGRKDDIKVYIIRVGY